MTYDEMISAVQDAEFTINVAKKAARRIAVLLPGNLREVDWQTLAALKKELRNFNIHTCEWKD